jgi:hypothetical protein
MWMRFPTFITLNLFYFNILTIILRNHWSPYVSFTLTNCTSGMLAVELTRLNVIHELLHFLVSIDRLILRVSLSRLLLISLISMHEWVFSSHETVIHVSIKWHIHFVIGHGEILHAHLHYVVAKGAFLGLSHLFFVPLPHFL